MIVLNRFHRIPYIFSCLFLKRDSFFWKDKADFVKQVLMMDVDGVGSGLFSVTSFDNSSAESLEFCCQLQE